MDNSKTLPEVRILGVRYHNLTVDEVLSRALDFQTPEKKQTVFFLNLDCLRNAQKDLEYKKILNDPQNLVLSDGIALKLVTRLFGNRMRDNCNGTDLSPKILQVCAQTGKSVYFLGGKPGVAELAAERALKLFPGIRIAGTSHGYFQSETSIVDQINASGADVLFVGMGAPIQEKFIMQNRDTLKPRLCLGIGAFIDYLSGTLPRAPEWMIKLHLEWSWRVLIDPRRMIRRYLLEGLPFMISVLWIWFKSSFAFGKERKDYLASLKR